MLLLKKLFMALLSLLTLLVCLTASADNGQGERWKWYYSGSRVGSYYDINTLSYDSNTNVADVWTKDVDINGNTLFVTHFNLNYTKKTYSTLTTVIYDNGVPRQKNYYPPLSNNINPGPTLEVLADRIADYYHIPHMYKGGPNRWKKIYTQGPADYYIATDCLAPTNTPGSYKCWVKIISGYNKNHSDIICYLCNFNNHTITTGGGFRTVIPDSLDEAVYNGAYDIYKEQHGN